MAIDLIRRGLLAIGLLLLAATSATAKSDYWFIGQSSTGYEFIDPVRIQSMADGTKYAWVTLVNEGEAVNRQGYKYNISYMEYNCAYNWIAVVRSINYDGDGNVKDDSTTINLTWKLVVPESLGEAEKKFVCADPATWASSSDFVDGVGDPQRFADYRFKNGH